MKTRCVLFFAVLMICFQTNALLGQTASEFTRMGSAKIEFGDYDGAITDFTSAIRLQPDYEVLYRAYFGRGFAKFQKGDYEGAKTDFDRAIREHSNDPQVYVWRAYTKYQLRYSASSEIADYNRAILLDPNYAEAYFNRGHAKIKNRQLRGGCIDLRKAYELGYDDAEPHIRIHCGEP